MQIPANNAIIQNPEPVKLNHSLARLDRYKLELKKKQFRPKKKLVIKVANWIL